MNRLDLVIDALENSEPTGTGWVHVHEQKHQAALQAARELKELYPQGAKVRPAEFIAAASIGVGADFVGTPMIWAEWPTRSEEVKHD